VSCTVDILADILLNSRLNPGSISRERDVILREMKEVNRHKEELVLDHLAMAFDGSGLGRMILGPKENILQAEQGRSAGVHQHSLPCAKHGCCGSRGDQPP
jgi:predicted Zn-dependent peptidase